MQSRKNRAQLQINLNLYIHIILHQLVESDLVMNIKDKEIHVSMDACGLNLATLWK